MSEQYRCTECGHFVEIQDDATCDVCHVGKMEHLRYIKGGAGSHWEGCEEVHWDCKIAQLEAELARLTAELAELNDKAVFIQFENEDELPAGIKDDVYSAMFECSHVDGVRLFPYIEENGQKYFLVMIEEENKSRLVYIVTMYRYGDREKHSYVLGAFSTENDARECGEKEKDYRGGKYEPEIIKLYVDSQRIDDFVGDSDHEHDDRIL